MLRCPYSICYNSMIITPHSATMAERGLFMNYCLSLFVILMIISGCSKTTAFEHFKKLDARQERAATSLQTASIIHEGHRAVIISAIYLNHTDPKVYDANESFLVAFYAKDHSVIAVEDDNNPASAYRLTLNNESPLAIKPLEKTDPLRKLMPINNDWNSFYKIDYAKNSDNNLTLKLSDDRLNTASLLFKKGIKFDPVYIKPGSRS